MFEVAPTPEVFESPGHISHSVPLDTPFVNVPFLQVAHADILNPSENEPEGHPIFNVQVLKKKEEKINKIVIRKRRTLKKKNNIKKKEKR